MTRREQIFALVTDEGVAANDMVAALGISSSKARELLGELAEAGRIFRGRIGHTVSRYFLTAESAAKFSDDNKITAVLAAVTESGWTVNRLMIAVSIEREKVRSICKALVRAGKLFAVTVRGTTTYFPTKESADAFQATAKPAPAMPPTVQFKATVKKFTDCAQIIVPPHVKPQQCPPFRGLGFSETQPKERAFSSLGIGRYMPDEDAMLRRVARKGA